MRKIQVPLGSRSYDILVGDGLLSTLGKRCAALGASRRCLVVTDSRVEKLHGAGAVESLEKAGFRAALHAVPEGESSKSLSQLGKGFKEMIQAGLDRKSLVIALGGGVVGDLAGFMAASFLRGIDLVQVPTSLLAQVDSSVGGKTGVNLPQGKNLVGAFHQPRLVLCDTRLVDTLPEREYLSGLAEVVKYGVIRDARLFGLLERERGRILDRRKETLSRIIARCCRIKAEIVAQDEKEGGLRAILNFGHTVGHALEARSGYGRYLHGEAISIGQVAAARLSCRHARMPRAGARRIEDLLSQLGLPVRATLDRRKAKSLWSAMQLDKKNSGGEVRFVLAHRIGQATGGHRLEEDQVLEELTAL